MGVSSSNEYRPSDNNDESSSIVWLDPSADTLSENKRMKTQLRSIINCLKTFSDATECEKHIRSVPGGDRILLIVTGGLGQNIVPRIHAFRQIVSIYVFCFDKKKHEEWIQQFKKVKGLFTKIQELIDRIQSDCIQYSKIDELCFFNIQGQSTSRLNGDFVHSQVFLDVLIRIKPTQADKDEFISRCSQIYEGNETQLAIVREFSKTYSSDRALSWYTKESFLYRILNKAIRVQNIDLIYLFRFFIIDILLQLKSNRCSSPIKLYRSQRMSEDEIQILKNSVNQFISINSFLSTVVDRYIALAFLNIEFDNLETVLFQIEADPAVATKPFADITQFSNLSRGREILIMIGSIFRIENVSNDGNEVWVVRMTLCSDEDHDLKTIYKHMRNEHGIGEKNLLSFANVLADMGKFNEAEKYYLRFLNDSSLTDPDIAGCYHGLGNIADDKGDYVSSLKSHEKALKERIKNFKPGHPYLASSYNSIGCVHFNKGDYQQALISYNKAYDILKTVYDESHPDVAMCLNNMGCIYEQEKNYSEAFECHKKALKIRKELLPEQHPDIGQSFHNIGNIYRYLGQLDLGLKYYNDALTIQVTSLPSEHCDIALTLESIGNVYKNKGDLSEALSYYKRAVTIYHYSLPNTHPSVLRIEAYIRYLS